MGNVERLEVSPAAFSFNVAEIIPPAGAGTDTGSGTYNFVTTSASVASPKKIIAQLDDNMPLLMFLSLELEDGTGVQTLSATPVDMLININEPTNVSDKSLSYVYTVILGAVPQVSSRVVTLTLTDQS
ncbi:MAG: hypothetical protein MRY21_02825 [Simkaniaceae bacterium]|nr:hypothetical protein [Simkaniaceae bacterium]